MIAVDWVPVTVTLSIAQKYCQPVVSYLNLTFTSALLIAAAGSAIFCCKKPAGVPVVTVIVCNVIQVTPLSIEYSTLASPGFLK